MQRRFPYKIVMVLVLVLCLAVPLALFFGRAPLIVVSDADFDLLYGNQFLGRLFQSGLETSLRLLRPVKNVLIPPDAGTDIASFTVAQASDNPYMVIFPYRYAEAAITYASEQTATGKAPKVILQTRTKTDSILQRAQNAGIYIVETDRERDFYQAGLLAASLSGNKAPVLYTGRDIGDAEAAAFDSGLKNQGLNKSLETLHFRSGEALPSPETIGCIVISGLDAGTAAPDLTLNLSVPLLLFSWLDPAVLPSNVWAVFDDSPWALALSLPKEGFPAQSFPSRITLCYE
jgi:hypothetical protein